VVIKEVGRGSTGIVYLSHDAYYGRGRSPSRSTTVRPAATRSARAYLRARCSFSEAHLVGMAAASAHTSLSMMRVKEGGHCYIVTEHVGTVRARLLPTGRPDNLLRIDDTVEIIFKWCEGVCTTHNSRRYGDPSRQSSRRTSCSRRTATVRIIDFGHWQLVSDSDNLAPSKESPAVLHTCHPKQVQSLDLHPTVRICTSLGAVMYELLTGSRPFSRAGTICRSCCIRSSTRQTAADPHSAQRESPRSSRTVVAMAPAEGAEPSATRADSTFAAELTRVTSAIGARRMARIDRQEQFWCAAPAGSSSMSFSHAEIWEVLRASNWQDYDAG